MSFDASGEYVPEPDPDPDIRVTDDSIELTIHVCMPSLGEPCGRPCHRCAITDHEFRPVNGHPDDDECTFGGLAFYCGATRVRHTTNYEEEAT